MNKKRYIMAFVVLMLGHSAWAQRPIGNISAGKNPGSFSAQPQKNNANHQHPENEHLSDSINHGSEQMGIIYDSHELSDSVLKASTFIFSRNPIVPKILSMQHPTLEPTGTAFMNPIDDIENRNFYLSKGLIGSPHYPIKISFEDLMLLRFIPSSQQNYELTPYSIQFYQTQRPYTVLSYNSSLHKDMHVKVLHTQNIMPRWNVAMSFDNLKSDGVYTNSSVKNHLFTLTTNYYSEDARYQVEAGYILHTLQQGENGGIVDETQLNSQGNRAGITVEMYKAMSDVKKWDLFLHQRYNLVRQFQHVKTHEHYQFDTIERGTSAFDSILLLNPDSSKNQLNQIILTDTLYVFDTINPHKPLVANWGVVGWNVDLGSWKRGFYDSENKSSWYDEFRYDPRRSFDSVMNRTLENTFYWTNDAYMDHKWRNPLKVYGGVKHRVLWNSDYEDFSHIVVNDGMWIDGRRESFTSFNSLNPFAKGIFGIGGFELEVNAQTALATNHLGGDYILSASATYWLDSLRESYLELKAGSKALAPEWFFYHFNGNNYSWNVDSYHKVQHQQLGASVSWKRKYEANLSLHRIGQVVYLNEFSMPVQNMNSAFLAQADVKANLQWNWMHWDMYHLLQWSSNQDVARVPVFSTKNSFYADTYVFKRALRLQTGMDLRFHTRFHADGWNPIVASFYRQNEVEVGGYPWIDFFVTIQVKRASIYAKVVNVLSPMMDRSSYYSIPRYPGEDLGVYWGVIWKFFD